MTEMPKAYDPASVEGDVFRSWVDGGYFGGRIEAGQDPYCIVIPPPNVTGSLHMGHALNNTIQDVLIRRQRMAGRPTRWVVGTDHAGIATQNKVEQKLAKEGLSRYDVGRDRFVGLCWEWRREHGSTIINQLKAMGCSCDYADERFTMDPAYQRAVRKVFVELFDQGLIYRGMRIINWCPRCATALSDIEVEHEEVDSALWYVRYPLKQPVDGRDHLVVATTRPETMLGDTCVAVNPDDERYRGLVGATVVLPLLGREIPIVADAYVDPAFGTGAVKVTPAHDPNDFEIGERHGCAKVNILDAGARITEEGGPYEGLDRFEARKRVVADLDAQGLLEKIDEHMHAVGHCYRCHTVIEPWLSDQWFVDMKPLAAPAIEVVREGRVRFHPARWTSVYYDWMENIRDWCVSRQLWWGHQIPVFYCDACGGMSASEEDLETCPDCGGAVRQDPDVLDTWFSSALWPFATLGWPDETPELAYYYPTEVLSTARDILFLWVARMIMQGLKFAGDIPFSDVIIHPTVFNAEGKRMSKSLGTGVDPLDLMAEYGADGMRFGLMLQTTGTQDIKFAEEKLLSSRNFANKMWNASRFVLMNLEGYEPGPPSAETVADAWILSRLATLAGEVDDGLDSFEFGDVSRALYEFFWSEFCDWYIELSKARLSAGGEARLAAQRNLVFVLDQALRLLHPMMPFITEAIWRRLPTADAPSLMIAAWPSGLGTWRDEDAEHDMSIVQGVVTQVRRLVSTRGLSPRTRVDVLMPADATDPTRELLSAASQSLAQLGGVDNILYGQTRGKISMLGKVFVDRLRAAVLVDEEAGFDVASERAKIRRELDKVERDLQLAEAKLKNEGFLSGAPPEVVKRQEYKVADLRNLRDHLRADLDSLTFD